MVIRGKPWTNSDMSSLFIRSISMPGVENHNRTKNIHFYNIGLSGMDGTWKQLRLFIKCWPKVITRRRSSMSSKWISNIPNGMPFHRCWELDS
jgi:hypothetical protein